MSRIAAKQVHRQEALQPRLALPAGRTVSLEEGRRLAKLVNDEEDRLQSEATQLLERKESNAVVLEESVSKRILLLRQKQNKKANVKAAVAYANRLRSKSAVQEEDGVKIRDAAARVLRRASHEGSVLKQRRQRAEQSRKQKKRSGKH
ncbi:hypothetical protein ABB37_09363 [Leptomonas pyrrhocoris]|uniref:Uncharacterized protein n=1 Tax=Leptomonas pyrrhocoris TaxID=157538 RepID=A0A0M9FQK2_LEPPY|nr:hypothetical protein ABB37_09363 [Leptomonas pyrrhocoris]XP_015652499.1 hypothetical protein ABB37_09363 [Leptomonas pyrrhocoris]KPA74059.1 hypothetical protein ABB37_09363 [Leptomonas pyrrhocoris]KPA74060.1 hypothetical protein ABB37_09363 [Leptomonas pyrrhocoris]|eukprot:XP_015652498.1 hypothetical protein ABB37_09363 [Leptomonas pyrrhocoris]